MPIEVADPGEGPATHALVIGVGDYLYFEGGDKHDENLSIQGVQLESPPVCAFDFADWLLGGYAPARAPLATIELLVSGPHHAVYGRPDTKEPVEVPRATFKNVEQAFVAWSDRLETSKDHVGLFFFSGHGFQHEDHHLLLLEDFGENRRAPFNTAINFTRTRSGMENCAARQQYYFIDACRTTALTNFTGTQGQTLITPGLPIYTDSVEGGTYLAAASNSEAYAEPGKASFFTEALLDALRGQGAAKDQTGRWVITPPALGGALEATFAHLRETRELKPYTDSRHTGSTPLHKVAQPPRVPVTLRWKPSDAFARAKLYVWDEKETKLFGCRDEPSGERWDVSLDAVELDYLFRAAVPASEWATTDARFRVDPPRMTRLLEIQKAKTSG